VPEMFGLAFQPPCRGKARSSRAWLREIERAAVEASSGEDLDIEALINPQASLVGSSRLADLEAQEEDLEAQAELMREQVDAFLKQQVFEAKRQVEEAQAVRHLLQACCLKQRQVEEAQAGCLQRVKEEMPKVTEIRSFRADRSQSLPPITGAPLAQATFEAAVRNATVRNGQRCKIEDLYQEHVQLKIAFAASQADAAATARKSAALQAQVDALLSENEQLQCKVTDCQKESDVLMYTAASKEKLLKDRLKEKQDRIEQLQVEKFELRHSLAQRGDVNSVIRSLDSLQLEHDRMQLEAQRSTRSAKKLQQDYDKMAQEHAELKKIVENPFTKLSAKVVCAEPLVVGIEAEEDESASGAASEKYVDALTDFGCTEALQLGRVKVPMDAGPVPVCVKVVMENDCEVPWPETIAAALVSGDACGCALTMLGPALPGEHVELSLDLLVPAMAEPGVSTSMWSLVNAATGRPLGPLLVFEAVWTMPVQSESDSEFESFEAI